MFIIFVNQISSLPEEKWKSAGHKDGLTLLLQKQGIYVSEHRYVLQNVQLTSRIAECNIHVNYQWATFNVVMASQCSIICRFNSVKFRRWSLSKKSKPFKHDPWKTMINWSHSREARPERCKARFQTETIILLTVISVGRMQNNRNTTCFIERKQKAFRVFKCDVLMNKKALGGTILHRKAQKRYQSWPPFCIHHTRTRWAHDIHSSGNALKNATHWPFGVSSVAGVYY